MADPRKPVNIFELIADASAKPKEVVVSSPIPPVVVEKKTPVPKKTAEAPPPKATIVPQAQPTQAVVPTQAPTQSSGSFLSNLFSSSKVEPGEYSTGKEIGSRALQFIGNFGNSLAGQAQLNPVLNQAFAKARQDYMDKDPNSRSSVLYRGMAQRMGLPIRGDESAYNLKEQMPNVKEFLQSRDMDLRERMASMRGQGGVAKPKILSGEQQKVVSNSSMALSAIDDMRNALKKGTNTFSIVGDNDFTEARRRFAEGFGRLQSGGVIGEEELKNFEALAPRATDTAKQQQDKLRRMEAELRSRIELAGVDPNEVLGARSEASAASQIRFVKDTKTGRTLKVNGLGEILE
jgi:hypothetical protein